MAYPLITLTAFVFILSVELADRALVAMLVLGARFPHLPAWLGVVTALGLRSLAAAAVGAGLGRLPGRLGALIAAAIFAGGAVFLVLGARQVGVELAEAERRYADRITLGRRGWRAAGASFLLLGAEWRGPSALLTVALAAAGRAVVPVFVGSWLALAVVAAGAVLLGGTAFGRIRLRSLRYVGAAMCAALAVLTVVMGYG